MNYCTKCLSYYQKPGTCNCYATAPIRITPAPYYPTNPYPWWGIYPPYHYYHPTTTNNAGHIVTENGNVTAMKGVSYSFGIGPTVNVPDAGMEQ